MYPTVSMVGRKAAESGYLGPYYVAKGTVVVASIFAMGRDERNFADPLVFKPERWVDIKDDGIATRKVGEGDPYGIVHNFGGGNRSCIGKRFAEEESIVILCGLIGAFRVRPAREGMPQILDTVYQITTTLKDHLELRFEKAV